MHILNQYKSAQIVKMGNFLFNNKNIPSWEDLGKNSRFIASILHQRFPAGKAKTAFRRQSKT